MKGNKHENKAFERVTCKGTTVTLTGSWGQVTSGPVDVRAYLVLPFKMAFSKYFIINHLSFVIKVRCQKGVHCRVRTPSRAITHSSRVSSLYVIEKHNPEGAVRWISTLGQ